MIIGNGRLNLRDCRGIVISYQFASEYDDRRGLSTFDTTAFDDGFFAPACFLAVKTDALWS